MFYPEGGTLWVHSEYSAEIQCLLIAPIATSQVLTSVCGALLISVIPTRIVHCNACSIAFKNLGSHDPTHPNPEASMGKQEENRAEETEHNGTLSLTGSSYIDLTRKQIETFLW